jgi:hypothetical protein
MYHASDLVIVLHRPELLQIQDYNYTQNGWPVTNVIYMHLLKQREGEPKILIFKNNLKYNSIEETDLEQIKQEREVSQTNNQI